jgi:peptidoglycan hydrolase CwlO-like protein
MYLRHCNYVTIFEDFVMKSLYMVAVLSLCVTQGVAASEETAPILLTQSESNQMRKKMTGLNQKIEEMRKGNEEMKKGIDEINKNVKDLTAWLKEALEKK